jgi:hypothetical protein
MVHFEPPGDIKQSRLRDFEGIKCSLRGIEIKKAKLSFWLPVVGTVVTVEDLLQDVYERLQRLS